ncbi:hypothetical protein PAL_GLEAN10010030 [Pteropus alecto]|uniref:Uncharacterized protein n=1 Tax=Pteropus alecto TaxID=9402 RepID=L5KA88_PTEAL|nr:hypothetical protein PAL_GLEAN10010030 [Pteropus alecto]
MRRYAGHGRAPAAALALSASPGSHRCTCFPAKRPSKASWAITASRSHLTSRYLPHLRSVPLAATHAGPRLRGLSHKSPRALAPPPGAQAERAQKVRYNPPSFSRSKQLRELTGVLKRNLMRCLLPI